MKKYIIGMLFGFGLALSVGAHADDIQTVIGKTIDGEFFVTVNDQKLPVKAITSEGTSYVPLRSFGESQGYSVTFDADLGINLTKKTVGDSVYQPNDSIEPLTPEQKGIFPGFQPPLTLNEIDGVIESAQGKIKTYQQHIGMTQENMKITKDLNPQAHEEVKAELAKWQDLLSKKQAELADLERQKAELQK